MRFEEAQQGREQHGIGGALTELASPDSGQVDEPLRPTFAPKRCRQRGEGKSHRIIWRITWYWGVHPLNIAASA